MKRNDLPAALPYGRNTIGFQMGFAFDAGSHYDLLSNIGLIHSQTKFPRPILLAIWYPAAAKPNAPAMSYTEYINLPSEPGLALGPHEIDTRYSFVQGREAFRMFTKRLADHQLDIFADLFFDCNAKRLSVAQRNQLAALLTQPTMAIRNAQPADGKYPLLLYHPGLGGSFSENSLLCEYLASHGYIVVSSAYQPTQSARISIDRDLERSHGDFKYMLNLLQGLPFVDWQRVGVMGHSFGAIAALRWPRLSQVVDAVVSLDSTLDYDLWLTERNQQPFVEQPTAWTMPLLIVAERRAEFTLARQLPYAERFLLTFQDFAHDDFLAHQTLRAQWQPALLDPTERARTSEGYHYLCQHVHNFLDMALKGEQQARRRLLAQQSDHAHTHCHVTLEQLAANSTPPQLNDLMIRLATQRAEEVVAWCKGETTVERPLFSMDDLNDIGYELLADGRAADAIALFTYMTELYPTRAWAFDSLADAYLANANKTGALAAYKRMQQLLPIDESLTAAERVSDGEEVAAKIAQLDISI